MFRRLRAIINEPRVNKKKKKSVKMQYCIQQQTTYVYEDIVMWKFKNIKG